MHGVVVGGSVDGVVEVILVEERDPAACGVASVHCDKRWAICRFEGGEEIIRWCVMSAVCVLCAVKLSSLDRESCRAPEFPLWKCFSPT